MVPDHINADGAELSAAWAFHLSLPSSCWVFSSTKTGLWGFYQSSARRLLFVASSSHFIAGSTLHFLVGGVVYLIIFLCCISRLWPVTSQLSAAITKICAHPSAPVFCASLVLGRTKAAVEAAASILQSITLSIGWQSPELTTVCLGWLLQVLDHCTKARASPLAHSALSC